MTAHAHSHEERPRLAAVPSRCPLPHRGRDVVLLAGLSAAAAANEDLRDIIGGFDAIDDDTDEAVPVSGLVGLVARLDVARARAVLEGHRAQEELAAEWRRAKAAEWERAEELSEQLEAVLAGEAEALWAVRVLAGRLGAALAALPALEAAAATGGRRDLAAALQPLVAALRGQTGKKR